MKEAEIFRFYRSRKNTSRDETSPLWDENDVINDASLLNLRNVSREK